MRKIWIISPSSESSLKHFDNTDKEESFDLVLNIKDLENSPEEVPTSDQEKKSLGGEKAPQ